MTKKYHFEMTKRFSYSTCFSALLVFLACILILPVSAQDTAGISIKGVVVESGTGLPLKQVSISVASTGTTSETDEQGAFTIMAPNNQVELIFDLPGYIKRNIYINGRENLQISLVSSVYRSSDNSFNSPLGGAIHKDATNSVTSLVADDFKNTKSTTFDQALQGRVAGLSVINQSGMPGSKTFMNIRGYSTMYGNVEPILFIDGMIHDYSSSNKGLMEGFSLNPMDVVDIDDIVDISVQKDGASYLGAVGSNGVININTEQKSETSTIIKFSLYEGVTMAPAQQDMLNASQFRNYFNEYLTDAGKSSTDINTMYPWLNGDATSKDYYKYNNNTDWQAESYKPAFVNKYHFFLKGGDDIATYNISTGYLKHNGILDESSYNRFNLRINGKINITNKFSITPNAKLSLADSYTPNLGPSVWKNAVTSTLLMAPIMGEYARDKSDGTQLNYLDDTGDVFNVSNPGAITANAHGSNRNYHFLSSLTAAYKFSEKLVLTELVGLDFNNSRENIFLPDLGMIRVDSAYNSPGDFINEFRSLQSHTTLTYTTKSASGHNISALGGFRYLQNDYKYNLATDVNTASDDFKSLGNGNPAYSYLRVSDGDNRGLKWISGFANLNYNFRNTYFLNAVASYDGNSVANANARYNFFPSVSGAWRISSMSFLSQSSWLDDMKLRASWSLTGNMLSNVYDYSKLYYISERMNSTGVLTREAIPNDKLELEKKSTTNFGVDMTIFKQAANIHFDYFMSNIDNLIIQQELPSTYGYTNYYDNGGKLEAKGFEISADTRIHFGEVVWTIGASVSKQLTTVNSLTFINPAVSNIITPFEGGEFLTSEGNAVNNFYGYQTNGIYSNDAEASQITGPNGIPMQAGDVKYIDQNGDKVINNADKMIIGDPNPALFGGINTGLSYKNFQLAAFFTYSSGGDLFNYVRYKTEGMDDYSNQSTTVLDRWRPSNPSATMPKTSYGDPRGNTAFSDRWIEDGSYLRLKQLTLNYSFPPKTGIYKGLTVYLTGTNLLTFTKYTGYDPDFLYSNNPFYMGIDYGKIPQSKSFIIGLKLDL
jgi:TonB-linked SusC/RagA family outer membrane protein